MRKRNGELQFFRGKENPEAVSDPLLIPLPSVIKTFDGSMFDPREDCWKFSAAHRQISMNFSQAPVTASLLQAMKLVFCWYAENRSAGHTAACFSRLQHLLRYLHAQKRQRIAEIADVDILNYRAYLDKDNGTLLRISGLLQRWNRLHLPGVTTSAMILLQQLRLSGNELGKAVLTHDPLNGPLTDIEFEALNQCLEHAFKAGICKIDDYLLCKLVFHFGARPSQLCLLKTGDLEVEEMHNGVQVYFIRIPRVKQGKKARRQFRRRPLVPNLGKRFLTYAAKVECRFSEVLDDCKDAPLFPSRGDCRRPDGLKGHRTTGGLATTVVNCCKKLVVYSERTGKPLHITVTRLRRTLGSRSAAEGHGELLIADALDHSTTQTARVYVEARSDMVQRIDAATAPVLAPLARAFTGRIIENETEATRRNDATSRVYDPRFRRVQGSCGDSGLCRVERPIGCYTCASFEPWRNGPHDAVLKYLLEKRDTLIKKGCKRIAHNLDRTILACADVVRRCTLG